MQAVVENPIAPLTLNEYLEVALEYILYTAVSNTSGVSRYELMLNRIQRILNLESTPAPSLTEAVKGTVEVGGKIVRSLDYRNNPEDPEVQIAGYGMWKLSYLKKDIQNDLNSLATLVGRAPASQLLQIMSDVEGKKMWSNHVAYRLAALAEVEEFLERPSTKRVIGRIKKSK